MRQYRSWAAVLGAILWGAASVIAQAPQSPTNPPRRYDGWQSAAASSAAEAGTKQAYFQASGSQLPSAQFPSDQFPSDQLPSGQLPPAGFGGAAVPGEMPSNMPPLPNVYGASAHPTDASGMVLPAGGPQPAYDQFSNPGGQLPPTDVLQASGSGLRNAPGNSQPVYPPGALPSAGYAQAGNAGQIYPPQGYGQSAAGQTPQSSLRSIQPQGHPGAVYSTVSQQQQVAHNGAAYTIPIVSQDPRFVSPPPAPRVGNFATSPYQPYRLAAYQTNPQVPAQTVQAPLTQATQPAVVANTSTLPQYQPTVGIYPTAYQTGYQYCAPNIPSNGVPQLVPGAVAPPTLPPNLTPQLYTPNNAGFKPLFSLGQENYNVQLGRGVIGQPTVYVPGQPVRNFLRYISP